MTKPSPEMCAFGCGPMSRVKSDVVSIGTKKATYESYRCPLRTEEIPNGHGLIKKIIHINPWGIYGPIP